MKIATRLLLVLTFIAIAFPATMAQVQTQTFVTYETTIGSTNKPLWVQKLPSATNVLTKFEGKLIDGVRGLDGIWIVGGKRLMLSVFLDGGTNVSIVELKHFNDEKTFVWDTQRSEPLNTFPDGLEKMWVEFAKDLLKRYQLIGEEMYVETSPLKYFGEVNHFTDGVILTKYLFADGLGKYRVLDEEDWIGELPKIDQTIFIGTQGLEHFQVAQLGERFLLAPEVFSALRKKDAEQRRMFPTATSRSAETNK